MGNVPTEKRYLVRPDIKGTIICVRKVQDKGRVQIPSEIRKALGVRDDDDVYWIELDGRYYIAKSAPIP